MLMPTHRKIIERITGELNLDSKTAVSSLGKGLATPDRWKDYPHHYGKEREVKKRIVEARKLLLHEMRNEAFFQLGVTLHYIQYRWVTVSGSDPQHGLWEEDIDDSPFVDDLGKMMREFPLSRYLPKVSATNIENAEKQYLAINNSLCKFEGICRSIFEGYDGQFAKNETIGIATLKRPDLGLPIYDLNFAHKTSSAVALSVCTPENSPTLRKELEELGKDYIEKLERAEEDFAKKIDDLNKRKAELGQKGGLVNKLKKLAYTYDLWFYRKAYEKRRHLLKVQKSYEIEAEELINAYAQWYNIASAPHLNIEHVGRLLVYT